MTDDRNAFKGTFPHDNMQRDDSDTYLFSHLPHAVDELHEDGGSVLIRVVLVAVTYPLHTYTRLINTLF